MKLICKRLLRRLLIFILLLAAPVLAVCVGKAESPPPAGFYMAEASPMADRIRQQLLQNGFVAVADPERLPEQVRLGALSCGVVFPNDLSQRVALGQLEKCITVYVSPSSFAPTLYQSHAAAAVFREYVPYLCATAFQGTAVTQEAVLAEYEAMFAQGYAFSFDVVPAEGTVAQGGKSKSVAMGAAAIVLLGVLTVLAAETAQRFIAMLPRLGLRKSLAGILLPETGIMILFAAAFGGGGLALAGFPELVLPMAIYCIAIWGIGLLCYGILGSVQNIYVLLPVLVIAAAALCPVYTDLSLVLPWLARVRLAVPAYWLWCIPDGLGLWTALSLAALAAGVFSINLRCSAFYKYKI